MSSWNKYIEEFNKGLPKELRLKRHKTKFKDSKKTYLSEYNKRKNKSY